MNKKKCVLIVLACCLGVTLLVEHKQRQRDFFYRNVEALTSGEGEVINCIPDENSVCVDGDYGVVQPRYYYSKH